MTAEERLAYDPTSELWGEHRSRYRFAADRVAGRTVLDVACGSGLGLPILREAGARTIGIDYDASILADVKQRACRLIRADATRLPLRSASVDVVVSFETIEHVADAGALVREMRRVLKPGGQLVLSTPNRAFGPAKRHTANQFHIREFTASELRGLLLESFSEVRLYGQRPRSAYRYVPYLMFEPTYAPSALAWKAMVRLPFGVRNRIALALSGSPFYPADNDYEFLLDCTEPAHALLAVAQ